MKNPIMVKTTTNLSRVPTIKPMKVPSADLTARVGLLLAINSPKSAPRKGPKIIPQNPRIASPTKKPRNAPNMPSLLALYLLAPKIVDFSFHTN